MISGASGFCLCPDSRILLGNAAQCLSSIYRHRGNGEINKENSLCRHIRVDNRFNVTVWNLKVQALFGLDKDCLVCNHFVAIKSQFAIPSS